MGCLECSMCDYMRQQTVCWGMHVSLYIPGDTSKTAHLISRADDHVPI